MGVNYKPFEPKTNEVFGILCPVCGDWQNKLIETRYYSHPVPFNYHIYECQGCHSAYSTYEATHANLGGIFSDISKEALEAIKKIISKIGIV